MSNSPYIPGLEGVVAAETRLSSVDGQKGELIIAGFPVEELAPQASHEEVIFLLWFDRLPTATELADLKTQLAEQRCLSEGTIALLRSAAAHHIPTMDALRMGAASLDLSAHPSRSDRYNAQAVQIVAQLPLIAAAYWRLRQGLEPLPPDPSLGQAANYLYLLTGEKPSPAQDRALETYLNTVVDHGLNASTFAARVIIATQSDLISAITGALGALKGPLHGGAPGPALDTVFAIGTADRAEPYLRELLGRGERLMGFGHRVYKVRDPRADVLAAAAATLYSADGDRAFYDLAIQVEQVALRLLEEHKPGRHLQTNVEFYTALLLHGLGLPTELFTPTFAISRAAGWVAHCLEQQQTGRLMRPQSVYLGVKDRQYQG